MLILYCLVGALYFSDQSELSLFEAEGWAIVAVILTVNLINMIYLMAVQIKDCRRKWKERTDSKKNKLAKGRYHSERRVRDVTSVGNLNEAWTDVIKMDQREIEQRFYCKTKRPDAEKVRLAPSQFHPFAK